MTVYEPGTVAVATVLGVENVRVFRYLDIYGHARWDLAEPIADRVVYRDADVTDVRPLVVLDLDPTEIVKDLGARRNEAQRLVDMLRETADEFFTPDAAALARKVADQIEAQSKRPRIPEPGLWGVVVAWRSDQTRADACTWVKRRGLNPWRCDCGKKADWSDLMDPTLVRDGIEDGAK